MATDDWHVWHGDIILRLLLSLRLSLRPMLWQARVGLRQATMGADMLGIGAATTIRHLGHDHSAMRLLLRQRLPK